MTQWLTGVALGGPRGCAEWQYVEWQYVAGVFCGSTQDVCWRPELLPCLLVCRGAVAVPLPLAPLPGLRRLICQFQFILI